METQTNDLQKFNTDALWSACKRRNVIDILTAIFENIEGGGKFVEELKKTSRLSDAKIGRLKDILNGVSVGQTTIDVEVVDTKDTKDTKDKDNATFEKLKKAISKGKKKKAKKIAKELRDKGYKGAIIDALEKQIEDMD